MSLFNRPAWARSQPTTTEGEGAITADIFSHSSRAYREIVAEQERKKQAKLDRKKEKEARRESGKREVKVAAYEGGSKKRRISQPEEEGDHGTFVLDEPETMPAEDSATNRHNLHPDVDDLRRQHEPVRRSPRHTKHTNADSPTPAWKQNSSIQVVDLGSSESEIDDAVVEATAPPVAVEEEESDDEFAALARRARQERQSREQLETRHRTSSTTFRTPSPRSCARDKPRQATPQPDPTVQLFITSTLQGTGPLIVHRKLSQNIGAVRRVWCQKQGFTEEAMNDVFLIHRMRRVYDVTTCRSLGLSVDSFGNVMLKGAEGQEGVEKVALEAVTEDLFRQLKTKRAQESQGEHSDLPAGAGTEEIPEQPMEESFIRLLLKAKGQDDFRLKVKPTTTFSKIATAYLKKHQMEGQSAYLEFDGERLSPDDEVQSTDVSDMDCIDVHIASQ